MQRSDTFSASRIWVLDIHIVIGSYLFLYTLGVFNPCQDNVAASLNWGSNKALYINIFSSIVPVGALFGTILTGPLIDRFGRRTTTMWNDIFYCIGTTILVMPSTVTFGIGRFLTGLSAGIFMTIGPIYVTEVTPEVLMGKIGPIIVIANNLGLMTAYGLGLALPTSDFENDSFNYWWLFMFLLPAAICIYQFCYFKFVCLYDTPQYYMARNMVAEANQALGITYTAVGMNGGLRRLNSEIKGKFGTGGKPTFLSLFTDEKFRKMMRVGCIICMLNQLSGLTAIIFYSTGIFSKLGGGIFISRLLTFIMGIVNLISSICSIFLLHAFGRKTLLVSGQIFLAIDLVLLGIFSGYVDGGVAAPAIFAISFFFFFSYSLGATLWLYVGEVLNDQVLSFACVMNMSIAILISFLFPVAIEAVGINNSFLFFAVMMVLGAIYSGYDLVETKNKEKEDILIEMKVLDQKTVVPEVVQDNDSLREDDSVNEEQPENAANKEILQSGLDATIGPNN